MLDFQVVISARQNIQILTISSLTKIKDKKIVVAVRANRYKLSVWFMNFAMYVISPQKYVQFGYLCSFDVESQIKYTYTSIKENVYSIWMSFNERIKEKE